MKAQKVLKKTGKILGIILAAFVAIMLIANLAVHILHSEFYRLKTDIAPNPGLWDNYVPQGITFNDDENYYATCGYMKHHKPSRIYTVDAVTKVQTIYELTSNGQPWNGHTGGLAYTKGKFYLASEKDGVFIFDASQLSSNTEKSKELKTIEIGLPVKVNNNSSFCFTDDTYLFVGEYAHTPRYKCNHEFTYSGLTHTSIITKYSLTDLTKPLAVYAIPDDVQGCVFTEDGYVILSRSWFYQYAMYDTYSSESIVETPYIMDGAPVYFFTDYSKRLTSIFYTEDVDVIGDKLITMTEGGANMYYSGKLLFDYSIYQFNLSDLKK